MSEFTQCEAIVLDYLGGEYEVRTLDLYVDAERDLPELLRSLAGLVERGLIVLLSDNTWELTDRGGELFGGLRQDVINRRERLTLE